MLNKSIWDNIRDYCNNINERNYCTVVALHTVTGQPIQKCFDYMSICGRAKSRGVRSRDIADILNKSKSYRFIQKEFSPTITLKKFAETYNNGTYYVVVSGYALAVIDGVIFDFIEKPLRRVKRAFRVYENNKTV